MLSSPRTPISRLAPTAVGCLAALLTHVPVNLSRAWGCFLEKQQQPVLGGQCCSDRLSSRLPSPLPLSGSKRCLPSPLLSPPQSCLWGWCRFCLLPLFYWPLATRQAQH